MDEKIMFTWQMSEEHLQIFALHAPLFAPLTSKYVQFSELVDPQPAKYKNG